MWKIILNCDRTYDGLFFTAVKTTKIYCRPSCRSRKPKKINVEFFLLKAEVERAGYRACKRCQPEVEHSPHVDLVRQVVTFLVNHAKETITLEALANHVGVSPYHLERIFKQETSVTPRSYLEKVRIGKVIYLLENTSKTNLEICYEVGFKSPSNFYKVFKKWMKQSPNDYRKELSRSGYDAMERP